MWQARHDIRAPGQLAQLGQLEGHQLEGHQLAGGPGADRGQLEQLEQLEAHELEAQLHQLEQLLGGQGSRCVTDRLIFRFISGVFPAWCV